MTKPTSKPLTKLITDLITDSTVNTMQSYAIPCNSMEYPVIPCNTVSFPKGHLHLLIPINTLKTFWEKARGTSLPQLSMPSTRYLPHNTSEMFFDVFYEEENVDKGLAVSRMLVLRLCEGPSWLPLPVPWDNAGGVQPYLPRSAISCPYMYSKAWSHCQQSISCVVVREDPFQMLSPTFGHCLNSDWTPHTQPGTFLDRLE